MQHMVMVVGLDLIKEVTVEADSDYVDIDGLDIKTHKFYLLIVNIKNGSSSFSYTKLYVEEDYTDANYYTQRIFGGEATVSAERLNEPFIGSISDGQTLLSVVYIILDADGYLHFDGHIGTNRGNNIYLHLAHGSNINTFSNITKIRIAGSVSKAIGAGSKILIFGYKA